MNIVSVSVFSIASTSSDIDDDNGSVAIFSFLIRVFNILFKCIQNQTKNVYSIYLF